MALAANRKVTFDYEILEKYSAGIELTGAEVKSVRAGRISLAGAHVSVRAGEAFLVGADIQAYQPGNQPDYEPARTRRLLLSRQELADLAKVEGTKGLTVVPISVYNKGRFIKVDLAVARGRKRFDKRQAIKKRDAERDLKRTL